MSLLFELLQVSLGTRAVLSRIPTNEEWLELYDEACKQAVAGVAFHGLGVLREQGIVPPQDLLLQWIGLSEFIVKQRNEQLDKWCYTLLSRLEEAGLHATILKGQGVAKLYGEELSSLRQSGDIDVYVSAGKRHALDCVKGLGIRVESWDYKHAHLRVWEDVEVELHYHVEMLFNLGKNKKLQKWFKANEGQLYTQQGKMVTPSVEMNVFYILLHIYRHFFTEGIGMRQLMDYFFVLKTVQDKELNAKDSIEAVSAFGMGQFAKGLMWVMQEVFAMPEDWMLWESDEKEGRFILKQVMEGGNFGHYREKNNRLKGPLKYVESLTKHSLHLIKRYPSEALWTPIWIVWHKGWKMVETMKFKA